MEISQTTYFVAMAISTNVMADGPTILKNKRIANIRNARAITNMQHNNCLHSRKFHTVPIRMLAGRWVMMGLRKMPYINSIKAKLARQPVIANMMITIYYIT
jgi:hypothetical protein